MEHRREWAGVMYGIGLEEQKEWMKRPAGPENPMVPTMWDVPAACIIRCWKNHPFFSEGCSSGIRGNRTRPCGDL